MNFRGCDRFVRSGRLVVTRPDKDQWIQWKSIDWRSEGFAPRPAETLAFETHVADQAGST
jgi:hypothetical protein